jgi:hypothetical protein
MIPRTVLAACRVFSTIGCAPRFGFAGCGLTGGDGFGALLHHTDQRAPGQSLPPHVRIIVVVIQLWTIASQELLIGSTLRQSILIFAAVSSSVIQDRVVASWRARRRRFSAGV